MSSRSRRAIYAAQHFAINTDINKLISPDLDWRKRDIQFEQAFDREKLILAVVEAPTPELASSAANALADKLKGDTKNFEAVQPLGIRRFFAAERLAVPADRGRGEDDEPAGDRRAPDRDHGGRSRAFAV